MAQNILFEVSPVDPATSLPVTLRFSMKGSSAAGTQLDGYEWIPVIESGPVFEVSLFSQGRFQQPAPRYGDIALNLSSAFGNRHLSNYNWDGALGRVWVGTLGSPFASYTKVFEGSCGSHSRQGVVMRVPLYGSEAILRETDLLSSFYAGTGGAEGYAGLKGTLKPVAYGECQNIEPILINPALQIYQYHDGASSDVLKVYEIALDLGAPIATVPTTYAALAALDTTALPVGTWAKAPGIGMFRLGSQPSGKLTADIRGALDGATYVSTLATIIPAMLKAGGVAGANIDQTSFNAFSGYAPSIYLTSQVSVGDIVAEEMAKAWGYYFASSSGVFRAASYLANKTAIPLNSDRSSAPFVVPETIRLEEAWPPNWRVRVGGEKCWSVHSPDEVSSAILTVQEDIQAAHDAAVAAQADADQAQADASLAIARHDDIANDNILDRSEKAQEIATFQRITADKAKNNASATSFGISTENTAYNSAYSALNSYLTGLSPAFTDTSAVTAITRTTYRTKWQDYYDAEKTLLAKIAAVTATLANWTGIANTPTPITAVTNSTVIDNSNITINGSGQISTGAGTLSPIIENGKITVNVSGILTGIGTGSVVVDNTKQLYTQVSGTPTNLAAINSGEGTKLTGIAVGATADLSLIADSGAPTVAVAGNRVSRSGGGGSNYPDGAFYTKIAQPASFNLQWVPNSAGQNAICGMGIATSQVAPNSGLTNLDYTFFAGYSSSWIVRKPGLGLASGTYTPGDVFRMAYDGGEIVFKINDTTVYTATGVSPNQAFYAIGSVTDGSSTIERVTWTPNTDRAWDNIRGILKPANSAGTNLTLVAAGTNGSTLTFPGNAVLKPVGATGYSWAAAKESYADACTFSCSGIWNGSQYPGTSTIGFSTTHPNSFSSGASTAAGNILFGWLISGTGLGFYFAGSNAGWWSGTVTGNEQLEVRYDGTQVQWVINGTVANTVTTISHPTYVQPGFRMYLVCDVQNQGSGAKDILFSGSTVRAKSGATLFSQTNTTLNDAGIITASGTAAGIAGQGTLATRSNVAWAAEITGRPANVSLLTGTEGINNAANNGNLISNSDFATGDFTGWSFYAGAANASVVLRTDGTIQSGAPTRYVTKLAAMSGGNTGLIWGAAKAYNATGAEQDGIRVVPGEQYFLALDVSATSGYSISGGSSAQFQVYYLLADGTLTGGPATGGSFTPTTSWATVTASFTAPSNAVRAYVGVYWGHSAGVAAFTNLRCWQRINVNTLTNNAVRLGTNITRNDGTTSLTDALAVTSLGVAASISGQGTGATANNLAGLDSTANTKLSGIAAGATVGAIWGTNITSQPTSLSGINSTEGTKLSGIAAGATVGATWGTNITSQPTTLAGINSTEGSKLSGIQTGADVTANSQHSIVSASATLDFAADYTNTLLSGQISKTVAIKRFKGTTDYSASTTWAASATSGITCSISSAGILSFTAVANGTVTITGTYNSVAMQVAITITRTLGAPPAGGGSGATSASTTVIGAATSSSYVTGVSNTLTVAAGSSGTINLTTTLDFYISGSTSFAQTQGAYGKWQWRAVGGSWADVSTEVASSWDAYMPSQSQYELPTVDSDSQPTQGHIDVGQSKTGLTSGTSYEFRFVWRLSGGGPTVYGSGSFYAAQS